MLAALVIALPVAGGADPICTAPACTVPIASSQLQNLGQLKSELRAYYESGKLRCRSNGDRSGSRALR